MWLHVLCGCVAKRWPHSPSFPSPLCLHSILYTHTHTHAESHTRRHTHILEHSNPPWETKTDPAAWHKSYWFYYLLQWMIFLSQFLNWEMSSILITIVEGFFKPYQSGTVENSEGRRTKTGGRKLRFVHVWLWKKRGCDFSPWVRLNKDDISGFNSLNYYPQKQLFRFGFPRRAENGERQQRRSFSFLFFLGLCL